MKKDWTGNEKSVYVTLGASNHSDEDREINDYYATHPIATKLLLEVETFNKNIWEPACGEGHISKILEENNYNVLSSDIVYRGYGIKKDFLKETNIWHGDIITNPPYSLAEEFVKHALSLVNDGSKVAMFLRLQFLEGKKRKFLFQKYPPKVIYVSSSRIQCAKNGLFDQYKSSAMALAWFIWIKGYSGDTIIKWIN